MTVFLVPYLFLGAVLIALVALNAWATLAIARDRLSLIGQRAAQVAFVWLVPVVGAALALYLKRKDLEPGTGRYGETPDVGEDYGMSGRNYRELKHDIDAMSHGDAGGGAGDAGSSN